MVNSTPTHERHRGEDEMNGHYYFYVCESINGGKCTDQSCEHYGKQCIDFQMKPCDNYHEMGGDFP